MRYSSRLIPGLLVGSLLLGSAGGAFAAKTPTKASKLVVAAGQVSAVTATSFILTAPAKKASATTTPVSNLIGVSTTTKETARKGTTGTLANGEYAVVVGTKTATGITARRVLFSATKFNVHRVAQLLKLRIELARIAAKHHRAVGTINLTATTTTSLAITNKAGKSLTFAITSATKFRVNKVVSTTVPTFTTGERAVVRFKRDKTTKSLVAIVVTVLAPKAIATA